jgi:hypothetical protein
VNKGVIAQHVLRHVMEGLKVELVRELSEVRGFEGRAAGRGSGLLVRMRGARVEL